MNKYSKDSSMPDPIDFVADQKYGNENSVPDSSMPQRKAGFPKYVLPMIFNLIAFFLIQFWVTVSCSTLSSETKGECANAWLNMMIVWPLEILVFIICLIILVTGFARRNK